METLRGYKHCIMALQEQNKNMKGLLILISKFRKNNGL